jgi:hypothetical protein
MSGSLFAIAENPPFQNDPIFAPGNLTSDPNVVTASQLHNLQVAQQQNAAIAQAQAQQSAAAIAASNAATAQLNAINAAANTALATQMEQPQLQTNGIAASDGSPTTIDPLPTFTDPNSGAVFQINPDGTQTNLSAQPVDVVPPPPEPPPPAFMPPIDLTPPPPPPPPPEPPPVVVAQLPPPIPPAPPPPPPDTSLTPAPGQPDTLINVPAEPLPLVDNSVGLGITTEPPPPGTMADAGNPPPPTDAAGNSITPTPAQTDPSTKLAFLSSDNATLTTHNPNTGTDQVTAVKSSDPAIVSSTADVLKVGKTAAVIIASQGRASGIIPTELGNASAKLSALANMRNITPAVASNQGPLQHVLTDITNAMGVGPAQLPKNQTAAAAQFNMIQAEGQPHPPGTSITDFGGSALNHLFQHLN